MITESATTSALTVAARMAGGVSMTMTSKSSPHRFELPSEEKFTVHFLSLEKIVGFDVDGIGKEFELGPKSSKSTPYPFVDQQAMCGKLELIEIDSQTGA